MARRPVSDLDGRAIGVGAAVAAVICLPMAVLGQVAADGAGADPPATVLLLFVGVLLGFVVGGYLAARRAPAAPYSNGALAALAAFAAIQVVAVATTVLRDESVAVTSILFNALIAYACGLVGATLASRRATRETENP